MPTYLHTHATLCSASLHPTQSDASSFIAIKGIMLTAACFRRIIAELTRLALNPISPPRWETSENSLLSRYSRTSLLACCAQSSRVGVMMSRRCTGLAANVALFCASKPGSRKSLQWIAHCNLLNATVQGLKVELRECSYLRPNI